MLAYIEALEAELSRSSAPKGATESDIARDEPQLEPSEPPTSVNVITVSAGGLAKRTPRHLYTRQRRGGMGVFDLDAGGDIPAFLLLAEPDAAIVFITDRARAFRAPVAQIVEAEVRGRGRSLSEWLPLRSDERLALAFPDSGGSYVALVTQRGHVRRIAGHYFGKTLQPGTVLYDTKEGGPPSAACWTSGGGDLFIVTRQGKAIRFAERLTPVRGCLGLRVDPDDAVAAVAPVTDESGVFLLADDGKGTLRFMNGFAANKAPGAGGKLVVKADTVVGAVPIHAPDAGGQDIFIISQLGKIIRFQAAEVPPRESVAQGVNCMTLRADRCAALAVATVG